MATTSTRSPEQMRSRSVSRSTRSPAQSSPTHRPCVVTSTYQRRETGRVHTRGALGSSAWGRADRDPFSVRELTTGPDHKGSHTMGTIRISDGHAFVTEVPK